MSLLLCLLVSRRNALFISICSSLFILDAMKYYTVNVNVRHTFPNATAAFSSFYCYPLSLSYCNRFHRVSNQSHLPFSLSRPST